MKPGDLVGGYRIVELLGKGGFGAVYRAYDDMTRRDVALKVVLPEHARDPELLARLRAEARAAAAVTHPNIAALYTTGEHEGVLFLIFELVPGGDLERLVKERGPLPWRDACRIGAEIASALAALHAAGIVHRDVKPENCLLDARGRPKLSDFGLVRLDKGRWTSLGGSITDEGEILGTFAYMSPEQANGARDLDGRTDLYALGALIFMLTTGRPPFEGRGIEILTRLAKTPPPRPGSIVRGVPGRLDRLVTSLMAKDRDARPSDARSVQRELEAIAKLPERKAAPLPFVALAGLALLVAGGAVVFAHRSPEPLPRKPPPPPPPPPPVPVVKPVATGMSAEVAKLLHDASAGDAGAMMRLGDHYKRGDGVAADEIEAFRWFEKSARSGDAWGMFNVGESLRLGRGTDRDVAAAIRWLQKAGEAGLSAGWVGLGEMYRDGKDVPEDAVAAVRYLRMAADQGNTWGANDIGIMLVYGSGCEKNEAEGIRYLRMSADAGNSYGMHWLGVVHEEGRGVEKDMKKAVELYKEAAAKGNPESRAALQRLGVK